MTKLSILVTAMLVVLSGQSSAQAADSAPTKPGNLSARLYSGAGGEIFWQRSTDDRGVRGYEITRNGQSLGVFDALSYYDASLKSSGAYTFVVTAIDTTGQRSASASVSLGNSTSPATPPNPSQPVAGAPAAPEGLALLRYSASAGELFWTRPTARGLHYEVSRNGTLVNNTTGVSFYDNSLPAATKDVTYVVVAIDAAGKRSSGSSIVLRANGTSGTAPATPASPTPGGSIAAPTGAKISVYSGTAAELFWTRPAATTRVTSTEVFRDGQLLGSTRGNSYFDATRTAGKAYRYELVAIASIGRSAPTVVAEPGSGTSSSTTPSTPTTPATPTTGSDMVSTWLTSVGTGSALSVDNSRKILPSLVQFINAEPARLVNDRFIEIYREAQEALDGVGSSRFVAESSSAEATTLTCPQGGTYTIGVIPADYVSEVGDRQHDFNQCGIDDQTFDGRLSTSRASLDDPEYPRLAIELGNYSLQEPLTYVNKAGVSFALDGYYDTAGYSGMDYFYWGGTVEIHKGSQSLIFDNSVSWADYKTVRTDANAVVPYKTMTGDFSVSGTITNGRTLQFRTITPMRTVDDPETYAQGMFEVKDVSGGKLNMTVSSEQPGGYTVRVDTAGRVDKYFTPWSDAYDFVILPTPSDW